MAIVYSYIRFSHKRQEQGDSVKRQLAMGKVWLDRHPEHILDHTLSLRDLGVSAFRGANLDKERGDLGKFIHLAKQPTSPIVKGSILMIERLDRFSRQATRKAYRAFTELVEAGVKVLVLDPETLIDNSNVDNMEIVLPLIIGLQLAYEQSREKRRRVGAAWKSKREAAYNGKPMSHRCPSWLKWDKKAGNFAPIPEAVKALAYIFNRTIEGCGQRKLTMELQKQFKPLGRSGKWNGSYIQKVLADRAVLGELQPFRFSDEGERIPEGEVIKDYYPRAIPDNLFYQAAAAKAQRAKAKGATGRWINLFLGLLWGSDGYPRHIMTARQTTGKGVYTQRRLVSWGYWRGLPNTNPYSFDYYQLESLVLACLAEIRPDDLIPAAYNLTPMLEAKRLELEGVEGRLSDLQVELGNLRKPLPQVVAAISDMEDRRVLLQKQVAELEVMENHPLEQAKEAISQKTIREDYNLRYRLRGLIRQLVERITIEPAKMPNRRVAALISVKLKTGGTFSVDTRQGGLAITGDFGRLEAILIKFKEKIDTALRKRGYTQEQIDRELEKRAGHPTSGDMVILTKKP